MSGLIVLENRVSFLKVAKWSATIWVLFNENCCFLLVPILAADELSGAAVG